MSVKKWFNAGSILILLVVVIWNLRFMQTVDRSVLCITSSLCLGVRADCFGKSIIPIIWYYIYCTKNDLSCMRIVQMKSRKRVWVGQCCEILAYAAVWTMLLTAVVLTVGRYMFAGGGWMNSEWADTVFGVVLVKMMLLCFLYLLVGLIFTLSTKWLLNTAYPALIVLAAVGISDGHFFIPIFFQRFYYTLEMWHTDHSEAFWMLMQLMLIALILFVAGFYLSGRKEFLNAKHSAI